MKKIRVIPRLDIKGQNVVKGIQLEGLRVIGKPAELAKKYYEQGADEILYIDIVASLYERNNLLQVIEDTVSSGIYIPITVGGGIRTIEDIKKILRAGGDKVAINTAAVRNPDFITRASEIFGSQCIVGSIEAKYLGHDKWEAYIDNGREKTGLDAIEWAKKLVKLGAGELLITSVDRDGTLKGYDTKLVERIVKEVTVPVIACGGAKNEDDIFQCFTETKCDGVALASILHYNKVTIDSVKRNLIDHDLPVREMLNLYADYNNNTKSTAMKKTVSIIDYDVGNMKSVISAFQNLGNNVRLVNNATDILESELLVLPGDGAFGYAMQSLQKKNLIESIKKYADTGKPLLGICLGMQILLTQSEEFGIHKGLNLIPGKVICFRPRTYSDSPSYTIPHMGWNLLVKPNHVNWSDTILSEVPNNAEAYFIHSYYVLPDEKKHILAQTTYYDQEFCSVIRKDSIYGVHSIQKRVEKLELV